MTENWYEEMMLKDVPISAGKARSISSEKLESAFSKKQRISRAHSRKSGARLAENKGGNGVGKGEQQAAKTPAPRYDEGLEPEFQGDTPSLIFDPANAQLLISSAPQGCAVQGCAAPRSGTVSGICMPARREQPSFEDSSVASKDLPRSELDTCAGQTDNRKGREVVCARRALRRAQVRLRREHTRLKWRPSSFTHGKLPPSIIPIALAALFSTFAVQPAGNGWLFTREGDSEMWNLNQQCTLNHQCTLNYQCPFLQDRNSTSWALSNASEKHEHVTAKPYSDDGHTDQADGHTDKSFPRDRLTELRGEQHARQENFASTAQSLLLNPNFVALLVRSVLILLEFGSRPLKNAKKMLSCALICYWLYHYRFGSEDSIIATRLDMSKLEPSSLILAQNAPLIVVFLVLKLSLKLADLSSRFVTKAWKKKLKRMRFAKLSSCII